MGPAVPMAQQGMDAPPFNLQWLGSKGHSSQMLHNIWCLPPLTWPTYLSTLMLNGHQCSRCTKKVPMLMVQQERQTYRSGGSRKKNTIKLSKLLSLSDFTLPCFASSLGLDTALFTKDVSVVLPLASSCTEISKNVSTSLQPKRIHFSQKLTQLKPMQLLQVFTLGMVA